MKVLICGGGLVGMGIARQLTKEDHEVTIVDDNEANIIKIQDNLEASVKRGSPSLPGTLEEAGINNAEMVIAVTPDDETNMVICQVAHSIFNIPVKIARIRNKGYLESRWKSLFRKDHLPIDFIISPELEVANAIINRLHVPGAMDSKELGEGNLRLIEVRCPQEFPFKGMSIAEIKDSYPNLRLKILSIYREETQFLPKITDRLQENDELFFLSHINDIKGIMPFFGHNEEEARRVVIVGGGNIGFTVAEKLANEEEIKLDVKIVELDPKRSDYIASKIEDISVINGSALDREILNEAEIGDAEAIICVTDDDEVNILTSILAKKHGCERSVCLINKGRSYLPLISSLGIDVDVNPRETTVSTILQHVRRGKVRSAHSLYSGSMEVVEVEIVPTSVLVGKSIWEADLPKDVKVCGIVRKNGEFIIPEENTLIKERDTLIVIAKTESIKEVDRIFSERTDFF